MGISIMDALRIVTSTINSKIPNSFTVKDNKLFLAKDSIPISKNGIELHNVQLVNKLPSMYLTVDMVNLIFDYIPSKSTNGTAYVYVGEHLKGTYNIVSGENIINVSGVLDFGTNIIKLTAVDEFGNNQSLNYEVVVKGHSVSFYNGDELLQIVENVPYNSSVSYVGEIPVKTGVHNPNDYEFQGWAPKPENVIGDMECHAVFKFVGYLFGELKDGSAYGTADNPNYDKINAYWTTIGNDIAALNSNDFNAKYQIGGRMIIPITLADGTSTVADVEIIAHNHDDLADNSGKAKLTFFCKHLPVLSKSMNEHMGDDGGWINSAMRAFVNEELLESLPSELKVIIKPVLKISDSGAASKTLITTTDSCWLASYDEVGFVDGNYNLSGQGAVYSSIFSEHKASRQKSIVNSIDAGGWWLRSSYYDELDSTIFWRVQKSGASYGDIQSGLFYVAFGFCI